MSFFIPDFSSSFSCPLVDPLVRIMWKKDPMWWQIVLTMLVRPKTAMNVSAPRVKRFWNGIRRYFRLATVQQNTLYSYFKDDVFHTKNDQAFLVTFAVSKMYVELCTFVITIIVSTASFVAVSADVTVQFVFIDKTWRETETGFQQFEIHTNL